MGDDYYGYTWAPDTVRVAEHDTYVPEGRTHPQHVTDFDDADKVAHIRVLWPMIQGLDATKIADLAQSWRTLSAQLTSARGGLDRAGGRLAPHWTGTASRAFLERVGGALFSLDQWIDAATTNAATIGRLADDVRATQPRVEGFYRAWLNESAQEKAKRDADAGQLSAQDLNDFLGALSKNNSIPDRGFLYRWARDSVPQDEIDRKYTALALPLVRKLADHFASAAATGVSLPGRFKGPTTFKPVVPTFGSAPGLPPALPASPPVPRPVVAPVPVPVSAPVTPVPSVGLPPGVPVPVPVPVPVLGAGRPPGAPALPAARSAPRPPALPAATASARPGLPALPGRTAPRAALPPPSGRTRRGVGPTTPAVPALPGRTRAPGAPATARGTSARGSSGRTAVPPAAGPRLGGRTARAVRTTLGRLIPGSAAPLRSIPPRLAGRIGEPVTGRRAPGRETPEFRRPSPPPPDITADVGARPAAPPSLGGRRGHPVSSEATGPAAAPARPELTGRTSDRSLDTRPAVEPRRTGPDPVTAPDEAFAPADSAPPVIERPGTPVAQPAGPALGRA